jgi:hypothetical protein
MNECTPVGEGWDCRWLCRRCYGEKNEETTEEGSEDGFE